MQQIILASTSPRRHELLAQMGVSFQAVPSDFEEHLDDLRTPEAVAIELGLGKAEAVAAQHPDALVIGSDLVVALDGKQMGKQETVEDERAFLHALAGRAHTVTTSIALICQATGLRITASDTVRVVFKPLSPEVEAAMEAYIASDDWRDKAVYAIQDKSATTLIDHIEGDYTTVVGLPTQLLAELLQGQGIAAQPVLLDAPAPVR